MSLAKLKDLLNHERFQVIGVCVTIIFFVWFFGCESKVRSLGNPQLLITRSELNAEVDFYLAQAEIRFNDLDKQDEFKRFLVEKSLIIAEGGAVNPYGIFATVLGIFGIGATVDNVRKRNVIRTNLKQYVSATKATSVPTDTG